MNSLTDLITLALALSVAVERVMEILKGLIPALAQQQSNLKPEYLRGAILHLISVLIGALAAYAGNINFLQKFSSGPAIRGSGISSVACWLPAGRLSGTMCSTS